MQPHHAAAITLITQHCVKIAQRIGMDRRFGGVHARHREEAFFRRQHRHHLPIRQHGDGGAARCPIRPLHIANALKPPFIACQPR